MFRTSRKKVPFFREEEKSKEFRAVVNENTSLVIVEKQNQFQVIIKKELLDYEIEVTASEAPIKNFIAGGEVLPYEYVVAETEILEKEIFKFNEKIQKLFGKKYDLKLNAIRLCIGTEDNYVTIDEGALREVDIMPTIRGLQNFIKKNRKSVIGFTIRRYDTKKGNLIFCEGELNHPIFDLQSIKLKIIANLSQRGLYMQKHHTAYGLHVYYILRIRKFSDLIIQLFNEIDIPIEMIYLKRKSSIQNWRAIECELNEKNLKNYLQFNFTDLSHTDVEHIVAIVRENKFNFEIANMMADLLNKMKGDRVEIHDGLFSLEREDIAAAAKVVVNYFGFNEQELSLPSNLDVNIIKKSIDELDRYIH
ncbi:MAG: hypothetical protein ACTSRS_18450 [Candidatus Helarchaeota archaeon]